MRNGEFLIGEALYIGEIIEERASSWLKISRMFGEKRISIRSAGIHHLEER